MFQKRLPLYKREGFHLFLMILPFLIILVLLAYLPLYGWIYSLYDYKPGIPLSKTAFVGLKYFKSIVQDKFAVAELLRVLRNTFMVQVFSYLGSPLPMIFAIFLTEVRGRHFKKTVQTVTTIPNFISWVLVFTVAFAMFSTDDGLINKLLVQFGWADRGINFLGSGEGIWVKMWLWTLWKNCGWSAILYFAAIAGIDQELYEAARVDGAGRFRMMWHITLPHLSPTYFVLLVLSIANFLNTGFEQYYVFFNGMNKNQIEVLDLFVYLRGMVNYEYPFSIAVGILKSFIGVVLLFVANRLSKAVRGYGIM